MITPAWKEVTPYVNVNGEQETWWVLELVGEGLNAETPEATIQCLVKERKTGVSWAITVEDNNATITLRHGGAVSPLIARNTALTQARSIFGAIVEKIAPAEGSGMMEPALTGVVQANALVWKASQNKELEGYDAKKNVATIYKRNNGSGFAWALGGDAYDVETCKREVQLAYVAVTMMRTGKEVRLHTFPEKAAVLNPAITWSPLGKNQVSTSIAAAGYIAHVGPLELIAWESGQYLVRVKTTGVEIKYGGSYQGGSLAQAQQDALTFVGQAATSVVETPVLPEAKGLTSGLPGVMDVVWTQAQSTWQPATAILGKLKLHAWSNGGYQVALVTKQDTHVYENEAGVPGGKSFLDEAKRKALKAALALTGSTKFKSVSVAEVSKKLLTNGTTFDQVLQGFVGRVLVGS